MSRSNSGRVALVVAAVTGGAVLGVAPASAGAAAVRSDVERKGSCSASSRWDLELDKEHRRIEIEVDIDSRAAGQKWMVKITHEGHTVYNRTRTADHDGEIEVTKHVTNTRGWDRVTFRAVNKATGEVCRASARI